MPWRWAYLRVEAICGESVANTIKDGLPVLQHEIGSLPSASCAPVCRCFLRKAATNWQTPKPIAQILVANVEHRLKDGNAHQGRGERLSLERDWTKLVVVDRHGVRGTSNVSERGQPAMMFDVFRWRRPPAL